MKAHTLRILAIAAVITGALTCAHAQISPTPGGGEKPAGGEAKPGDAKPGEAKPKPKFDSPWNGERDPDGQEATEFGKLMGLYDTWQDAEAALTAAKTCNQGVTEAQAAVDAAKAAFDTALATYINGWSSVTYSGMKFSPGTGDVTPASQQKLEKDPHYPRDRQLALDALKRDDKKTHTAPAKCPPPETTPKTAPGADVAPTHTGLPPCDDGDKVAARIEDDETELAEIVEKERTATGDALVAMKDREATLRGELAALGDLKACPSDYHPPNEEGGGPSVTIGIGGGSGGGDDHHHLVDPVNPRGGHCDAAALRRHG